MITRRAMLSWSVLTAAIPHAAWSQPKSRVYRIGYLAGRDAATAKTLLGAFLLGMREHGYVLGQNFILEARYAEGRYERFPAFAAELVKLNVDLIVVIAGDTAIRAAYDATRTIPIVIASSVDPVGNGFADSLARPGRNVTGLTNMEVDITSKQIELLTVALPKVGSVAFLTNPDTMGHAAMLRNAMTFTQAVDMRLIHVSARTVSEVDEAFAGLSRQGARAVIFGADAFFNSILHRIAQLALANRIASLTATPEYVAAGGLMSYGQDRAYSFRRAGAFIDKILKGAKPGDLPIEQPDKFEFGINLKTAKALGVGIPQSLWLRANKVIK